MATATPALATDIEPTGVFTEPPEGFTKKDDETFVQYIWQLPNGYFVSAGRADIQADGFGTSLGFEDGQWEVCVTERDALSQLLGLPGKYAMEYLPDTLTNAEGETFPVRGRQTDEDVNNLLNELAALDEIPVSIPGDSE